MCPTSPSEPVCGTNNRTYPSFCYLLQQSSTRMRFTGACNRSDCSGGAVSDYIVVCMYVLHIHVCSFAQATTSTHAHTAIIHHCTLQGRKFSCLVIDFNI